MKRMKRVFAGLLCLILCCGLLAVPAAAGEAEPEESVSTTVFPDGSYCITTVSVLQLQATGKRATITGTKSRDYYNSNGILQFSVIVKGTFTYDGTTATATNANCGYHIYDASWSFYNGFSSCSGATATATCTFSLSGGGHRTLSVSLTCSPTGTLS